MGFRKTTGQGYAADGWEDGVGLWAPRSPPERSWRLRGHAAKEKTGVLAQCRRKDTCVIGMGGSQPGRAAEDIKEQLGDGEMDAQTKSPCPEHPKGHASSRLAGRTAETAQGS